MMDPEDCHYYCCGGCSGLFTTLGSLTRHKRSCTGKPDATQCKVFACRSEHLLVAGNCGEVCVDAIGGSLVKDHQQKTIRGKCMLVQSTRQHATEGHQKAQTDMNPSHQSLPSTKIISGNGEIRKKRKRGRPRKTLPSKETEEQKSNIETEFEQSPSATGGKSPKRSTLSSVERTETRKTSMGDDEENNRQIIAAVELERSSKQDTPLRKSRRMANRVEVAESKMQVYVSESPSKMRALMDNSEEEEKACEAVGSEEVDSILCSHGETGESVMRTSELLDQPGQVQETPVESIRTTHGASAFDVMLAAVESIQKDCRCESDTTCTCGNECIKEIEAKNESSSTQESLSADLYDNVKPPVKSSGKQNSSQTIYDQLSQYRQEVKVKGKKGIQNFYICTVCGWKTVHLGFFARHLQCHNGISSGSVWTCPDCDFTCKKKSGLKIHQRKHLKPFMCEYCSYCCASKKDLDRHLWTHTGEQPYACSMCNYRCRQHMALTEHMRKHSGEVLRCTFEGCNFTSTYKWTLTNHIANKHTLEKRFQCPDCSYGTSDSGSFTKHLKLHQGIKDYKCSQCEYRAVAKHDIVKHMRTHTKEKVYFCDRCKYSTSHSSGLRLHMMSHLGVKPWQCVLCGYNSISKGKVVRHIKQRHQEAAPANVDDAVINLGLKLDINMSNYRRANENGERIVYDVQQIPATSLDEVQVIVQELPAGADILQVTAESADNILLEHAQAQIDYTGIDAMQLQQLTTNMEDCGDIIITPENVGTIIIPVQSN